MQFLYIYKLAGTELVQHVLTSFCWSSLADVYFISVAVVICIQNRCTSLQLPTLEPTAQHQSSVHTRVSLIEG